MRRAWKLVVAAGVLTAVVAGGYAWRAATAITEADIEAATRSVDILSETFVVDRKYRSMRGPQAETTGALLDTDPPELLWIVGYRAVMVDGDGDDPMPQEFMCHANLNLDARDHRKRFGWTRGGSPRLFTLSQGQNEVRFPAGFGIPIMSDEALTVGMQVLNLNVEGEPFEVRHRISIDYVRDADIGRGMRPLVMRAATGLVSLSDRPAYFDTEDPDAEVHGEGCMVGEPAHGRARTDELGQEFSGHWVVKPGREENHTNVTRMLDLHADTQVHYIATHLHPFAKSLTLRDLTTDEDVYTSHVRNFTDKIGLAEVGVYSSAEGFALHADHEYELVSIYDNTSGEDQDSMAVMFLYVTDDEYRPPPGV